MATPEKISSELSNQVLERVKQFTETGSLILPQDYSPANALKCAMLILTEAVDKDKKPVLEVCSKESIATALLKMVVQGLSPEKNQGYFIPYGRSLTWVRSYQGSIALAKRLGGVKDVVANVIYNDDKFTYNIDPRSGYKAIIEHEQKLENIDNNKIRGAYAVVIYNDGRTDLEVMTIEEIKKAWAQRHGAPTSKAHENFTQEMAKKTVINRACKAPINSSNDVHLFIENTNPDPDPSNYVEDVKAEIVSETASEALPPFAEDQENDNRNEAQDLKQ